MQIWVTFLCLFISLLFPFFLFSFPFLFFIIMIWILAARRLWRISFSLDADRLMGGNEA